MSRGLVVLAILAALMAAPPVASGASNVLTGASTSPTSGTPETAFRLQVGYVGRFAALAVIAEVAGRTEPMHRVAGTATSGTWEVSVRLPAGSWPTRFRATAERGGDAFLSGPTLSVTSEPGSGPAVSPQPTPSTSPTPTSGAEPPGGPGGGGGRAHGAAPLPTGASQEPPAAPAETPAGDGGNGGGDDVTAAATGSLLPSREGSTPARAPDAGSDTERHRTPHAAPGGRPATTASPGTRPQEPEPRLASPALRVPVGSDPPADPGLEAAMIADELVLASTRVTAAWLAALLAVIAVALGVLARRRWREAARAEAATAAAEAERILRRRAVRAARRRLDEEDPIIASMERGASRDRPKGS